MAYVNTKKYPYIPSGRTILYVSADNEFMLEAKKEALEKSTDTAKSTGAVIVKDGKIIGRGANQTALKSAKLRDIHKKYICVRRIFKVPSGQKYWLCPGCAGFDTHGEAQAVSDAKAKGNSAEGADLYLYGHWWACEPCWEKMIKAGIKNVYLMEGASELF